MEKEPLLPHSPRKSQLFSPPSIHRLPEDTEITISPLTLSPSPKHLHDTLIFGSPNPFSPPQQHDINESFDFDPENQIGPSFYYSATKTSLRRSKTAPAMVNISATGRFSRTKPPQFGKPSVVRQGIMLLIMYLSFGVVTYSFSKDNFKGTETHPLVDALYFCVVTMCTIGYGDITPNSTATKLFSITFVLVGFGFVDILLTGVISYMLDLQENYLLKTIKGSYIIDAEKGRMRIRMKVALALGVVVVCIGVGAAFMHFVERLDWLDSFYLSVMSVTTVGYGDRVFNSLAGRLFASVWLLVSTLAVARAFLYLAEARVDKRHRMMAKWVLSRDMTVEGFLATDTDNNGFVSKSEYMIYMLKEMGKISEKDMMVICKQFERLDAGNCGKISLSDLMESHR